MAEKTEKLDCAAIRPLLSAFADNETTPAETTLVKRHLASCALCASELAFARAMNAALFAAPMESPAPELFERIAAATYARPTLRERFAQWLNPATTRWGLGTALAVGLTLAVVLPRMERGADVPHLASISVATPAPVTMPVASPSVEKEGSDRRIAATKKSSATVVRPASERVGKETPSAPTIAALAPKPTAVLKAAPVRVAKKETTATALTGDLTTGPQTQVVALPTKPVKAVAPTIHPTVNASQSPLVKSPAPIVAVTTVPKPEAPMTAAPVHKDPAPIPTRTMEKPAPETRVAAKESEPTPTRQVAMAEPTRTAPSFSLKLKNAGVGRREISMPSPPNIGSSDTGPSFDSGRAPSLGFNDNDKVASLK